MAATRAASACSTLTRPGLTLTRRRWPSTSTSSSSRRCGPTLDGVGSHTERARLVLQAMAQVADQDGIAQDADDVARPSLFHEHGRDPGVEGPVVRAAPGRCGRASRPSRRRGSPRAGRAAGPRRATTSGPTRPKGRSPPGCSSGTSSSSREPAPKPVASIVMAGIGPKVDPQAASIAAPVGVVSSTPDVPALGRDPLEQLDHRRRGVGQKPV